MAKILMPIALTMAGLALGAGGGVAAQVVMDQRGWKLPAPKAAPMVKGTATGQFVSIRNVIAPLVLSDGKLSGYVSFDIQLEVDEEAVDEVAARLPFLQHAINLRTFKAPLASGTDGMIPDVDQFRRLVVESANETIGTKIIHRVAITKAGPA